jgi:hypothetical protein
MTQGFKSWSVKGLVQDVSYIKVKNSAALSSSIPCSAFWSAWSGSLKIYRRTP